MVGYSSHQLKIYNIFTTVFSEQLEVDNEAADLLLFMSLLTGTCAASGHTHTYTVGLVENMLTCPSNTVR